MKKLYIILALVVVSILMVFAGDTIKILRIYHNGTFTAIPLANIDSIDHSRYNANGKVEANYTSSILEALDSTYIIPVNEIDSVVVSMDNYDIIDHQIDTIMTFIASLEGEKAMQSQNKLIEWLNRQNWVEKISLNDYKDFITIKLIDGLNFYIGFQCANNLKLSEETYSRTLTRNEEKAYVNVTSYKDESIIEEKDILYVQGMNMPPYFYTTANIEKKIIEEEVKESPVNCNVIPSTRSLELFDQNFSEFGLIIIGQTHGLNRIIDGESYTGGFCIEDKETFLSLTSYNRRKNVNSRGIIIYYDNDDIVISEKKYIFLIPPKLFAKKIEGNKNCIIYGNYCFSYFMQNSINNTIWGYETYSGYFDNERYNKLLTFLLGMLNGYTYQDCAEEIEDTFDSKMWTSFLNYEEIEVTPNTNRPHSKQRFFSITTNDVKEGKGISGIINGYKNLKGKNDGLEYKLYVHEGLEEFAPWHYGVKEIPNAVKIIDSEGSFEISNEIVNKYSSYNFIVGFEYAGKVYYGEMKRPFHKLCPDENHPHLIDLGLPSGTQWYCCNKGVHQVDQLGSLYSWEDRGTVPSLEQWYELCHLDYFDYSINGNEGKLFVGNKGYCIFLPEGSYWTTKRDGSTASCANISQGLSVNFSGCVGAYDKKPKPIAHSRNIVN